MITNISTTAAALGNSAISGIIQDQLNTGYNSPSTVVNDTAVGTVAWVNPTNVVASDDVYATATLDESTSNYLKATNFGFNIPSGATINGIEMEFERASSQISTIDNSIKIVKANGTTGSTEKSTGTGWPFFEAYASYGGASDLWGETWSASDINNSNFGVVISAAAPFGPDTVSVDHIRIRVYYKISPLTNVQIINSDTTASNVTNI